MEYWKVLLRKQKERGKKGFSLPFLLGSQQYLLNSVNEQGIDEIVTDMLENESFETCIRYCIDTCTLIFEIRNPNNLCVYPKYKKVKQANLSISIGNNDLGNSVEEVIENLKNKFQDNIEAGLYSARCDGRETMWEPISGTDEAFIKACFNGM